MQIGAQADHLDEIYTNGINYISRMPKKSAIIFRVLDDRCTPLLFTNIEHFESIKYFYAIHILLNIFEQESTAMLSSFQLNNHLTI